MPDLIPLNIDDVCYTRKPTKAEAFECKNNLKVRLSRNPVFIPGTELQEGIVHGRSFTAAQLDGTKAESFVQQRIVVDDIDNDQTVDGKKVPLPIEEQLTPEAAMQLMVEHGIEPYIIYRSFHDAPGWNRFRVIILLDETITDPVLMAELNRKFQYMFPGYDPSVKNLDRLFFGSTADSIVLPCTGKTTPISAVKALPDPKAKPEPHPAPPAMPLRTFDRPRIDGEFDLVPLLDYIDPAPLSYGEWRNVLMALKAAGYGPEVGDAWSSRDPARYHSGECDRMWASFNGSGVTGATITYLAKLGGWKSEYETLNEERWPAMDAWLEKHKEAQVETTGAEETIPDWLDPDAVVEPLPPEIPFNYLEPFPPELTAPDFPADALPAVLRTFARETAEELEVDVSMVATAALATIALCASKKYEVHIRRGWNVPVNLYCLICADSAERKSPVVNAVTGTIYGWQRRRNEELQPIVDRYQTKRDLLAHAIDSAMKQQKKTNGKDYVKLEDEINDLKDQLHDHCKHKVSFKAIMLDDTTPEAMAAAMQDQNERVGLFSTEAGAFDMLSGRYNSGVANTDLFLKAWGGDSYTVKRIGRNAEELKAPALTVLLGCQPSVLTEIMGNPKFRDRGLTARFLYCFPKHITGTWDGSIPVSTETLEEWQDLITGLLKKEVPEDPEVIMLEPDAIPIAADFYNDVQGKLRGEYECIQSWAGKYVDQTFRIAGLMAIASGEVTISAETLRCALEIGSYYLVTAMIAHNVDTEDGDTILSDAKAIWKKLDHDGMTQRDVQRMLQSRFANADELTPGLDELERRGYIRREQRQPERGGRPSTLIYRNPDALVG